MIATLILVAMITAVYVLGAFAFMGLFGFFSGLRGDGE